MQRWRLIITGRLDTSSCLLLLLQVDWLPATLLNVPVLIVDTLVYGIPVYLMAGFTRTAAPLFTFLLVLFCFSLLCDNLYRCVHRLVWCR